jgi:hypothetical protein
MAGVTELALDRRGWSFFTTNLSIYRNGPTRMNRLAAAIAGIVAVAVVLLVGAFIEYSTGIPFAVAFDQAPLPSPRIPPLSRNAPVPSGPALATPAIPASSAVRTDVPIVSNARGAEDAARADVPMGETVDLQRCYATMIARRLKDAEARTVCAKLIGGISQ